MPYMLAYALLFTAIGAGFIFIHLMIGKVVRPKRPDPEKLTVYECGEPTIGSAWVQFDLRFYVVALLFVIFDVEMAFFFPWAVVFGKTNQLAGDQITAHKREEIARTLDPNFDKQVAVMDESLKKLNEASIKEIPNTQKELDDVKKRLAGLGPDAAEREGVEKRVKYLEEKLNRLSQRDHSGEVLKATQAPAANFTLVAFLDILVFFAVLLVGFAYLWSRGDLNWVRSTVAQQAVAVSQESRTSEDEEPIRAELVSAAPTSTH